MLLLQTRTSRLKSSIIQSINKKEINLSVNGMAPKTTQNSNNVIQFPMDRVRRDFEQDFIPKNKRESLARQLKIRKEFADEIATFVMQNVYSQLSTAGLSMMNSHDSIIDSIFMTEILKASLYRKYKIPHSFQKIIDATFIKNDDGSFNIANDVKVKLGKQTLDNEKCHEEYDDT